MDGRCVDNDVMENEVWMEDALIIVEDIFTSDLLAWHCQCSVVGSVHHQDWKKQRQ